MQYFRSYPRGRQLMIFMLLVLTFFFTTSFLLNDLLTKIFGISPAQIEEINDKSSAALIKVAQIVQAVSSVLIFLLPGLLYAYLAHPRPRQQLGLVKPGKNLHFLLVILVMLGAMPVLTMLEGLIGKIDFGAGVKKAQEANDNMMNAMLQMTNFWSLLKALLIMAVIPGLGEEIFFRGTMMRFAKLPIRRSFIFPIFFTALVFAMAHSNVYGYLSIFLAGALLGTIYYLTGSLWCSILAHIFFNGSQIVLAYMALRIPAVKHFSDTAGVGQMVPWAIGGAALFGVSFYALWKNQTPLPGNWPVDFSDEEIRQFVDENYA